MHNMLTTIAFIECVFDINWETLSGFPHPHKPQMWSQYKSMDNTAQVSLVDIGNNRRYFQFKRDSIIQIVNNVISFKSFEAEELAVDESKKFPKKTLMHE